MISGISKKVIFLFFIFINFLHPSKSAESSKINKNINNRNIKITLSNKNNFKILSNSHNSSFSNHFDDDTDYVKFLKKKKRFIFSCQSRKSARVSNTIG